MPKTLKKSRLHSKKHKPKNIFEVSKNKSNLLPNLQAFKQNLLTRNGFVEYN